jgi:hypothetical protein
LVQIRGKHHEELEKIRLGYQADLEKLQKETGGQNSKLFENSSTDKYCRLLVENYQKIRNKNCDLTLELSGGKTLDVHKTILMGNNLLD